MNALAVDAGGTHCRIAWVTEDTYESVVVGAANASSDLDSAANTIEQGLVMLASSLEIPSEHVKSVPAYLGVAGVVGPDIAKKLRAKLSLENCKIEDDRPSSVRGAIGEHDGFVVHCGTGSFFAVQKNKTAQFAGGWGPVIDDVASAYWVGVRSLRYVLYAEDGICSHSPFSKQILAEKGDAESVVAFASNAKPVETAELAKSVTAFAKQGDAIAVQILSEGADKVTEMLTKLGWKESHPICFSGGFAPHYKTFLPNIMQSDVVDPKGEPLDGAVALARDYFNTAST